MVKKNSVLIEIKKNIFHPIKLFHLFYDLGYFHFFAIGLSGVFLNLLILYIATEFIFGKEKYYLGYFLGLAFNLFYNFYLYLILFKKESKKHVAFSFYLIYTLIYYLILTITVYNLVELLGQKYYFIIISGLIFFFSIINFFLFKFIIFKE